MSDICYLEQNPQAIQSNWTYICGVNAFPAGRTSDTTTQLLVDRKCCNGTLVTIQNCGWQCLSDQEIASKNDTLPDGTKYDNVDIIYITPNWNSSCVVGAWRDSGVGEVQLGEGDMSSLASCFSVDIWTDVYKNSTSDPNNAGDGNYAAKGTVNMVVLGAMMLLGVLGGHGRGATGRFF